MQLMHPPSAKIPAIQAGVTAPGFVCPFKVEVEASAHGAGAVLLQEDDHGIDHPVCYFSRKF